jgi:phage tail-like protein
MTPPFVKSLALGITPVDTRLGNSKVTSDTSTPGRQFFENFFLDRILTKGDTVFADWLKTIATADADSGLTTMVISLLNNKSEQVLKWTIVDAIPVRLSWSNLDAQGNEVLIETLEVKCDGISLDSK